jgi:hypothetical protein
VIAIVWIGAEFEPLANEGERAVIDGVFQDDFADARRALAVWKVRMISIGEN